MKKIANNDKCFTTSKMNTHNERKIIESRTVCFFFYVLSLRLFPKRIYVWTKANWKNEQHWQLKWWERIHTHTNCVYARIDAVTNVRFEWNKWITINSIVLSNLWAVLRLFCFFLWCIHFYPFHIHQIVWYRLTWGLWTANDLHSHA